MPHSLLSDLIAKGVLNNLAEIVDQGYFGKMMDPSCIYIHQKGRYPRGPVEPGDVGCIKEEIRNGLLALEYEDGKKILKNIYDRNELDHGPEAEKGRDLVLLSHPGFDLKGKLNSGRAFD